MSSAGELTALILSRMRELFLLFAAVSLALLVLLLLFVLLGDSEEEEVVADPDDFEEDIGSAKSLEVMKGEAIYLMMKIYTDFR